MRALACIAVMTTAEVVYMTSAQMITGPSAALSRVRRTEAREPDVFVDDLRRRQSGEAGQRRTIARSHAQAGVQYKTDDARASDGDD